GEARGSNGQPQEQTHDEQRRDLPSSHQPGPPELSHRVPPTVCTRERRDGARRTTAIPLVCWSLARSVPLARVSAAPRLTHLQPTGCGASAEHGVRGSGRGVPEKRQPAARRLGTKGREPEGS